MEAGWPRFPPKSGPGRINIVDRHDVLHEIALYFVPITEGFFIGLLIMSFVSYQLNAATLKDFESDEKILVIERDIID